MHLRLLHGFGVALLFGVLAWWLAGRADPALLTVSDLHGERWYRLLLNDAQVGYLNTRTYRDRLGTLHFSSDLRFVLEAGQPVRIRESLEFQGTRPFALRAAEQRTERPGLTDGTRIRRHPDPASPVGYQSLRIDGEGPATAPAAALHPADWHPADWQYSLTDYVGFETWLRETAPAPGAITSVRTFDFSRRDVVPRQFRIAGRNLVGYEVEHAAPYDTTRIQLDDRLRPVSLHLSGLFELQQTTRERALAPRSPLQTASYFVPVDRALSNHTAIRSLELEVTGTIPAQQLWPELVGKDGRVLHLVADPLTSRRSHGDELLETSLHPVHDPRIRALAAHAVGDATGASARIEALTRFVHGYLRYQDDDGRARRVLTLLDDPRGDCTEFADLLTTLGRSLGIPSRTVFGLAYAGGQPPAFRFHAWNELRGDDGWQVVDPTWNQSSVDATHIPLSGNVAAAMQLLTSGADVGFTVRSVSYH